MYKLYLPMALLMSLILGSGLAAYTSNSASAQNYGYEDDYSYGDSYSKYPTDDKTYECRTGPFEGFFTSSVEFCKHVKFDKDDRKDRDRDNDNKTGPQGPPGPRGPPGLSTINTTNIYTIVGNTTTGSFAGEGGSANITSIAVCDPEDTALSGSFEIDGTAEIKIFEPLANETGWNATALVTGNAGGGGNEGSVTADVVCFDNPPPHT
jgi:hypothetical protein